MLSRYIFCSSKKKKTVGSRMMDLPLISAPWTTTPIHLDFFFNHHRPNHEPDPPPCRPFHWSPDKTRKKENPFTGKMSPADPLTHPRPGEFLPARWRRQLTLSRHVFNHVLFREPLSHAHRPQLRPIFNAFSAPGLLPSSFLTVPIHNVAVSLGTRSLEPDNEGRGIGHMAQQDIIDWERAEDAELPGDRMCSGKNTWFTTRYLFVSWVGSYSRAWRMWRSTKDGFGCRRQLSLWWKREVQKTPWASLPRYYTKVHVVWSFLLYKKSVNL